MTSMKILTTSIPGENRYLHTHDIYQVQALLHHTDVKMTMQYIKDPDISRKLKESLKY